MRRVFERELFGVFVRPFMGLWILLASILLTWVAGKSAVYEDLVRVVLYVEKEDDMKYWRADEELLEELADIEPLIVDGAANGVLEVMEEQDARMAVAWRDSLWVYVRPEGEGDRARLKALAYEIGVTLNRRAPWQLLRLEPSRPALVFGTREEDWEDVTYEDDYPWELVKFEVVELGTTGTGGEHDLIPGVIGLAVAFLPFLLGCSSMSREFDNGTIGPLLVVSGVGWSSVVGGKLLFAVFATIVVFLGVLIECFTYMDVPSRWNVEDVLAIQVLAMVVSGTLGITVANFARSQFRGYFFSAVYLVGLVFFSGLLFPKESAADVVQAIANMFPLTFSLPVLTDWLVHGSVRSQARVNVLALSVQGLIATGLLAVSVGFVRSRL